MKQLILPIFCVMVIACNRDKTLTAREKLDSIQPGMTLSEVLAVYGPVDTTNRTFKSGECGYVEDSVTGEFVPGKDGISPLITLMMNDSTNLIFSVGRLMFKPELTHEEQKTDTMWLRINSLLNEHMKERKTL